MLYSTIEFPRLETGRKDMTKRLLVAVCAMLAMGAFGLGGSEAEAQCRGGGFNSGFGGGFNSGFNNGFNSGFGNRYGVGYSSYGGNYYSGGRGLTISYGNYGTPYRSVGRSFGYGSNYGFSGSRFRSNRGFSSRRYR